MKKVSTLTNKQLLGDHLLTHSWYRDGVENWSAEDILNAHVLIVLELIKRGLEHPPIGDQLDKDSEAFYETKFSECKPLNFTRSLPDEIILYDEFVTLVGSFAEEIVESPHDIDIIVPLDIPAANDFLNQIVNVLPLHLNLSSGPSGQHVPVYELVLRKRPEYKKYIYDYKVPLGQPTPKQQYETQSTWYIEPEFGYYVQPKLHGEHVFIHKNCDELTIFGNVFLPEAARTILLHAGPDQYIVEAMVSSTGTVGIFDILRHQSTELIDFTLKARMTFIDKFQLNANPFVFKVPSFWVDAWDVSEDALAGVRSLNVPEAILKDDNDMYYIDGRKPNWKTVTLAVPQALKIGVPNFNALKANTGYGKFEFNDIDEAWLYWGTEDPVAVEEKFDGFRCLIHKSKDDKVWIFTEDRRRDLAENFPYTVEFLKTNFKGSEFILDSELVWYDADGNTRPRQDVSYFIHGRQEQMGDSWRIDDSLVKFHVFDCLMVNSTQLFNLPWIERQKALAQVIEKDSENIHRVIPIMVNNEATFKEAVKKQTAVPGSEGAMLKFANSKYELDGRTTEWAKYKPVLELHLEVMKINVKKRSPSQVIESDSYMYDVGYIRDGKLERIGTTYGTSIKAKVGEILTVTPVQVLRNVEEDTLTFMFPRVKELNTEIKEADTYEQLIKIAETFK